MLLEERKMRKKNKRLIGLILLVVLMLSGISVYAVSAPNKPTVTVSKGKSAYTYTVKTSKVKGAKKYHLVSEVEAETLHSKYSKTPTFKNLKVNRYSQNTKIRFRIYSVDSNGTEKGSSWTKWYTVKAKG